MRFSIVGLFRVRTLIGSILAGSLAAISLPGCLATYPMGLTAAEWNAMPTERQAELRAQQYKIDSEQRLRADAMRIEVAAQRKTEQREQQARVSAAYANARYGDVVSAAIRGGRMRYAGQLYPCEPVTFDLVRGERKEIEFRGYITQHGVRKALITRFWVRLSDDGNSLYLNDDPRVQPLVLVNDGSWERGRTYRTFGQGARNIVDVDVADMIVSVRLREIAGAPQRVIIEHR